MSKKVKTGLALTAVALGVGYALGVLTAPKSGKDTRQDLKEASGKLKEQLEEKYSDIQGSLSDVIEQAYSQMSSFKGSSQDKLQDLIDQAKDAEYKVKDVFRAVRHGEASDRNLDKALNQASKAKDHLFKFLNK
ncbi:YtxH domain-containing protein [Candidatus Saccharibacteria bacterium]|nr:YtxH domain-containing protein [Candidatus Saccharibacteria bacterium]